MTENFVFIIGAEKEKNGPNKGKLLKIVKRQIGFSDISSISLSTKCDDFLVIHTPNDYDSVLETVLKTELITVISERYNLKLGRCIMLNFKDDIEYSVKKTTWQSGGQYGIHFVLDASQSSPESTSSGKSTTIRVPSGLPKDSRPTNRANSLHGVIKSVNKKKGSSTPPTMHPLAHTKAPSFTCSGGFPKAGSNNSLGSIASLTQDAARKKMPPPPPPAKKAPMVKALYDYDANEADELTIKAGDLIVLISKDDPGWWTGSLNGKKGLFPANYVQDI